MSNDIINKWIPQLIGCETMVDMGCGQLAPQELFESLGVEYTGVDLGINAHIAKKEGKRLICEDMTFTTLKSESFDLVYSRHSLEHSPFPLLTLMEWYRVAKHWLLLVLPNPKHYGWVGKNHYGVMNWEQCEYFLQRSGWNIIWNDDSEPSEIRIMCEKVKKIWVK
jgi:SAM-dependent methyltransferase